MINKFVILWKKIFWTKERIARSIGVKIGVDCDINTISFGSEPYLIEIGDNVQITDGVKFFTHGAAWVYRKDDPSFDFFGKINIGNNVYIGNNCLILPGVTVGNNVIIGAGSVVTKSVSDNVVVGGNPARVLGDVSGLKKKLEPKNLKSKGLSFNDKKSLLISLDDSRFVKK